MKDIITIQAKIKFDTSEDLKKVNNLMLKRSSCMRYVYQRLIESYDRKTLKRTLQGVCNLNSLYVDDAIMKAQSLINSTEELGIDPEKFISGGRKLVKKLQKGHINGEDYHKLKTTWTEKRKSNLYSRGDISKKVYLRINVSEKEYIYASISYGFNNHRFIKYLPLLLYGIVPFCSKDETSQGFAIRGDRKGMLFFCHNGSSGIGLNAYSSYIAWAETDKNSNLLRCGTIPIPEFSSGSKNKRECYAWIYANQLIGIAKEKGKAIVIEKLEIKDKGRKGDQPGEKSRRIRHNFAYKGLLEKIKTEALRKGIQVIKVNPAYTSVTGMLKYAPLSLIGVLRDSTLFKPLLCGGRLRGKFLLFGPPLWIPKYRLLGLGILRVPCFWGPHNGGKKYLSTRTMQFCIVWVTRC